MLYALSDATSVVYAAAISGVTAVLVALVTRPSRKRTKEIVEQVRQNGGNSESIADKIYRIEVKQATNDSHTNERILRLERYIGLVLRELRKVPKDG